jgi:hypothetical protein
MDRALIDRNQRNASFGNKGVLATPGRSERVKGANAKRLAEMEAHDYVLMGCRGKRDKWDIQEDWGGLEDLFGRP